MPAELTCQELVELVTDYFEGALPAGERARFDAHLADCEWCVRHLGQMRTTIDAVGALRAEDVEPEALDALLTVFRGWRAATAGPNGRS